MSKSHHGSREPDLVLGAMTGDHLAIWIESRPYRDAEDVWDANWLETPIEVSADAFEAKVRASLRADELQRFRVGLERVDRLQAREASLESLEDWLRLQVTMSSTGAITVSGVLVDMPGTGIRLQFALQADLHLADVRGWIEQLATVEAAFPVVGDSGSAAPGPVT